MKITQTRKFRIFCRHICLNVKIRFYSYRLPNRFSNDIAVIEMRKNIEFNDRVQPIEYSPEEIPDGEEVQFTGWGLISVCTMCNFSFNVSLKSKYMFIFHLKLS